MAHNSIDTILNDVGHINAYLQYLLNLSLKPQIHSNLTAIQELIADISVQAEILRQDMDASQSKIAKLEQVVHEVENEMEFDEYESPSKPKPPTLKERLKAEIEKSAAKQESFDTPDELHSK